MFFDPSAQFNPDFKDPNNLISPNDWTCSEWMNSNNDFYALDAHWAAAMTYDYFLQQHNRNSFDSQGSIIDVYVHHNLLVYPNPNSGTFMVSYQPQKEAMLFVYNLMGKQILNTNINGSSSIDIRQYPKGVYLVKVVENDRMVSQKVIVQ